MINAMMIVALIFIPPFAFGQDALRPTQGIQCTLRELKWGDQATVVFMVEGHLQKLSGTVVKIDPVKLPDEFGLITPNRILHLIDTKMISTEIYKLPNEVKLGADDVQLNLPSVQKYQTAEASLIVERALSNHLASRLTSVDRLGDRLTGLIYASGVLGIVLYFAVDMNATSTHPFRPWGASHFSSYFTSAIAGAGVSGMTSGFEAGKVKTGYHLAMLGAALIIALQGAVETDWFGTGFQQMFGANTPDMGDFYVGAVTAAMAVAAPKIVARSSALLRLKKARAYVKARCEINLIE